jgi:hypothetical protein
MRDPDQRFHWFLYAIIVAQFIIIAILLGSFSAEYLNNQYMQAWVKQNAPSLDLFLNGNLDVMFIGAAVGLTFLLIQYRRDAGRTIGSGQLSVTQPIEHPPSSAVLEPANNPNNAQDRLPSPLRKSRRSKKPSE